MKQNGIVYTPETEVVARANRDLLEEIRDATASVNQLHQLGKKVPEAEAKNPVEPFGDAGNTSFELITSVSQLDAAIKQMENTEASIREKEEEIVRIEQNAAKIRLQLIVAGILLALLLLYVIFT